MKSKLLKLIRKRIIRIIFYPGEIKVFFFDRNNCRRGILFYGYNFQQAIFELLEAMYSSWFAKLIYLMHNRTIKRRRGKAFKKKAAIKYAFNSLKYQPNRYL